MFKPHFALTIFLTLICAAGFIPALAQTAAAPQYSADLQHLKLRDAETLFATHNREVQAAGRMIEGAQADRVAAGARPNPSLALNTSSINTHQGVGSGNLRDKQIDSVIGLQQLFERGNKRELRMAAADQNIKASRGDYAEIERQQTIVLYSAYYDLVAAQEKVLIANDTAGSFQKTVDAVQRRLKAGDIAASDVSRIRVDALRAQNDARGAETDRRKAQAALAYVIGAERSADTIAAADSWPDVSETPVMPAVDSIIDGRADVQAAQARIAAAERSRELARALRTRDVTASVQFEHSPGDTGGANNSFGIGVSVPLFTSYYYEGEIRRAEVDLQTARDNSERVRAQALGEILTSRAQLEAARDRVGRFRESLLAEAQKAADAGEYAYSRGAIGVMDLLDSRRQLYATRLDAAAAFVDYAKALAAWQAAIKTSQIAEP